MRPARQFASLHNSALSRINKLRKLTSDAVQNAHDEFSSINRELSFVCLELHSVICNFTRAYFLSCTLNPMRESKVRVTCAPAITNYVDAIDAAMKACRNKKWRDAHGNKSWGRREEPPWHKPSTLLDSLAEIDCSNYSNVVAAYSLQTNVFDHLTTFRNFFAHRNQETFKLAQNIALSYSILPNQHPYKILLSAAYNRPQELIFDWIDDIANTLELLCR